MLNEFYQNLPLNIDPTAFTVGSFSVRWYSLSYIIGFLVVYGILMFRLNYDIKKAGQIFNLQPCLPAGRFSIYNKVSNFKFQISNLITDFLLLSFVAAVLGGRLGYVLFYDPAYFIGNPIAIFTPFDEQGNFIGFYGMSFFGAAISVIVAAWFFCKKKKIDFLAFADFIAVAIPAGYFFGRIGNFLNGELFGRITTSPLGMYFQNDSSNLRHPSQLYEAFFEGLFLFIILWIIRNKKIFQKKILFTYLAGYAIVRFIVEFFREPDAGVQMFGIFTIGQILSMLLLTGAGIFYFRIRALK